jgi:hypothetical protein
MHSHCWRLARRESIPVIILLSLWVVLEFGSALAREGIKDDLFDVSFPTAGEGWACGRWGAVIHTTDGGRTWARQDSNTDYTLSSISFVDAKNGWAVGDRGTILHTRDGGATWQQQPPPHCDTRGGGRLVRQGRDGQGGGCAPDFFPDVGPVRYA